MDSVQKNRRAADKQHKIAVVGAGGWGLALAKILSSRHTVSVWVYEEEELKTLNSLRMSKTYLPDVVFEEEVSFTNSYEEVLLGASAVIIATPSFAFRNACESIKTFIKEEQIVVSATKGLEAQTTQRMSEIGKEILTGVEVLTLSGPSHAEEAARFVPTAVVVAGDNLETAKYIRDVFMCPPHFRVYAGGDQKGVEIGGALKNIIAIAAGVVDGLKLGDNTKAALITRGLAEIVRFGESMGACKETFYGLSGIGDLIVTCDSMHSRNRRVGALLAEGKNYADIKSTMKQVAEGVYAADAAHKYACQNNISMPITDSVYKVLFENGDAEKEVMSLMSRSAKEE